MSSRNTRDQATLVCTPAADQTGKEGYTVTISGGTATVSSSATTAVKGVILNGQATDGKSTIAILGGFKGTLFMKAGGTITSGDFVKQSTDGTVVSGGDSGARDIGTALESAISGDLFEVAPFACIIRA